MIYQISLLYQLVAGILPLIVVFFYRKKIKSILLIYLSSSVIATILLTITIKLNIYNLHIFNTYVAVAIICLFIFYLKTLNNLWSKILIFISFLIWFFTFVWELLKTDDLQISVYLENFVFILWSILFYINYLINDKSYIKDNRYLIHFNSAIFLYNCSCFILFYFMNYIMKNNLWFIHNFIEGSSKLLIAYSFWKLPKTSH